MAKKGPKRQQRRKTSLEGQAGFEIIDKTIARRQQEAVLELAAKGRSGAQALEMGLSALIWADQLVNLFEAENRLPRPLACRPGCYFCCHNQIEVTPPEALLLGDYVAQNFSAEEKRRLGERIERAIKLKTGKTPKEVAECRQQLPCPCLIGGRCSVYPVRPLVCRAMHALDAGQCEASLNGQDLRPVAHYAHRQVFIRSLVKGLLAGCRALGCQAGALDLAWALGDCFTRPDPAERWLRGEQVFTRSGPVSSEGRRE
jgi:Fe-S-cluster containining protein